jgi:hypothetical protein
LLDLSDSSGDLGVDTQFFGLIFESGFGLGMNLMQYPNIIQNIAERSRKKHIIDWSIG